MDFDAIAIGSGQAGVPLATRLARSGKKVLLAERGDLGGTCINTGCTPTKTLVASARAAHVARTAGRLGVRVEAVQVDFPAVIARKDEIVRSWQQGVARRIAAVGPNLRLVRGHARLVGDRTVEIGGERYRAASTILNAGARPVEPPIPGLREVPWLDNRRVMSLRELPSHLVVVGGGHIGCDRRRRGGRADPRLRRADAGRPVRARHRRDGGRPPVLRGRAPVARDEARAIRPVLTRPNVARRVMSPSSGDTRPNDLLRTPWSIALALLLAAAAALPGGAAARAVRVAGAAVVSRAAAELSGSRLGLSRAVLVRDPDGHALLLAEPRPVLARPGSQ
jgi:Pyridine nucleotide-disulphide oxidoreductase